MSGFFHEPLIQRSNVDHDTERLHEEIMQKVPADISVSAKFKRTFTPCIRRDKSAGVLSYPKNKDGKELQLKFSPPSQEALTQEDAIEYCKKRNKRLPAVRELYDFCGDKLEPITCDREFLWSLSVRAEKDDKSSSLGEHRRN
jgi:hypothetical protein